MKNKMAGDEKFFSYPPPKILSFTLTKGLFEQSQLFIENFKALRFFYDFLFKFIPSAELTLKLEFLDIIDRIKTGDR